MRLQQELIQRQNIDIQNRENDLSKSMSDFELEKIKQKQISLSLQARESELIEKKEELINYEKELLISQHEIDKKANMIDEKEKELENKAWLTDENVYKQFYNRFCEYFSQTIEKIFERESSQWQLLEDVKTAFTFYRDKIKELNQEVKNLLDENKALKEKVRELEPVPEREKNSGRW